MEENDDPQADVPSAHNTQEIFQRAQETQTDRRFPANSSGIVAVPRGSKGPRSLYLKRYGDSFGFTLRHFIVYPPEGVTENDGRHAACGALLAPLDTIFVKHVRDRSAAKQAGLQRGDRLVAVNGQPTTDLTYQQVVNLISKSPDYLHLLVVPKEEDVLQRFFPDTAYNPVSNQDNGPVYPEVPLDRATAQQILTQRIAQRAAPQEFRVDAASWRYLNQPYFPEYDYQHHPGLVRGSRQEYSNRSTESVLDPRRPQQHQEIYAEIHHPNEVQLRQKSRAQPQVPLYRKMGRRASEGSHLVPPGGGGGDYSGATSLTSSDGENYYYHERMRAMQNKPYYLPSSGDGLATMDAGCRLQSSEKTRRESTSSISSSIADSSKGSTTTSYDSNSTLTGHEMDEEANRLAAELRVRQSVRQKEEFLRTPVVREFHGRPKRLERPVWPPNGTLGIPYEGDYGGVPDTAAPTAHAYSPRDRRPLGLEGVREAETAPTFAGEGVAVEQSAAADDRRMNHYHHAFQNVQKKAKEFETCADDSPRTDLSRSELARLSTKVLQPNVTERAHEYEAKTNEGARTKPTGATPSLPVTSSNTCSVLKRIQKDSRSLDSSGSNGSVYHDPLSSLSKQQRLSGNVIISSGSKYIHCPPPEGAAKSQDISSNNETSSRPFRARSNSAESWTTANGDKESATPPMVTPPVAPSPHSASPLLVPLPVLQMHFPHQTVGGATPPPRPHTLDLAEERPQRPARGHFKSHADTNPVVVKRRIKNNFGQDERNRRPESYLKATKGDQTSFGSDLSDNEDLTPQGMRNRYRKWQPSPFYGDIEQLRKLFEDSSKGGSGSSSSSLDREKFPPPVTSVVQYKKDSKVIREGLVHCKILQIDGKRAADRSWKQVTMVLKGPKLFLYKDRHHQSPLGTSDVSLDQSLSGGVDMRTSVVRVAEDYTKRKNVLRLSSVNPCRSEFLIQTENSEDLADWAKTLQEQVAVSTKAELDPSFSRQQAVPQTHPASTSIQVQGSHLSPQPSAKNGKSTMAGSTRNRSPTGQSPVSKTRKPSAQHDPTVHTSPKSKTWRGRVAKQFKKFNQGGHSPSSPTAPEGSTFGVPIEHCIPSQENCYLPRIVKVCTDIIDGKGLQMKGIYRIPGNCAAITALTEEINRNYEDVPLEDPKWNDIHVVSSLLKSYFRKMPDSLITAASYPQFVKADKIEDPKGRLEELKKLVRALPRHNYYTLKHVVGHLKRVNDNSHVNQMDTKNLSIVFGPTIFLTDNDTMEVMVANMNNHANIVQSLITHVDWFFPEDESESPPQPPLVPLAIPDNYDDFEASNQVLLNNIGKFEVSALNKEQKEKNGALLSSLFTAAQRKVMRKPSRSHNNQEGGGGREEPTTPTSPKTFAHFNMEQISEQPKIDNLPSITAKDMEKKDRSKPPCSKQQGSDKDPWFNYKTDQQEFSRRIENFKQETEAMLQRPRTVPISVDPRTHLSSSANNVSSNQQRLSTLKQQQQQLQQHQHPDFLLTKTHSATNVFTRPASATNRNSMDSMVQYNNSGEATTRYSYSVAKQCDDLSELDGKIMASRYGMRRGSSVENVNTATGDVNANGGGMKKVKYENENDCQRRGSLESLHKLATEDESLLSTMTKLIDQKLKEKSSLGKEEIPFVDESPEKPPADKETRVRTSDLYKNPSLHKGGQYVKPFKPISKESNKDRSTEKEEDTSAIAPDNERHISLTVKINNSNNKLKRSESLNKPERTIATNNKVKRSESLNKPGGDKLKRSDSLTKSEKTESNINKKRELLGCGRRLKETTKNKRKNGMPDRSIKRRHTVGGTKDPDKVTYIMDNENQSENDPNNVDNNKEKGIRTSSPDLSSTRRGERYLFEINLIGPENMVVALRQHFVGSSRPQSFPESNVFKVPLESHV